MLSALPPIVRIVLLAVVGAIVGALLNRAIYAWPYFRKRAISPWLPADPNALPRRWSDFIPILGWFGLRREHKIHGSGFWVRPLLIEIVWLIGLPWFYFWQLAGGLTGGLLVPEPVGWPSFIETWFVAQATLIALMFIATFIDFDERTIPDYITIPGTIFALLISAGCPWFRLPEVTTNLAGQVLEPIHFTSGSPLPNWHHDQLGLWIALAIFTCWILALLPKVCTLRYGIGRGLWIMVGSCLRPARKTACPIRCQQRRPEPMTLALGVLWLGGFFAIVFSKQSLPPLHWDSLFGSLVGLAFGGGMIWSIRILGRYAMQKEAMGFGDVTLMAMIGAFLGWQAALLTLPFAAFAALLIVVVCFLVTKESELAFGPYLCLGCTILLFGWSSIWPIMSQQFFFMGPWMFLILLAALILMPILLILIQWIKSIFLNEEEAA